MANLDVRVKDLFDANGPTRSPYDDAEFEYVGSVYEVAVVKPGRGEWTVRNQDGVSTIAGFSGENIITVNLMTMHSGDWNAAAVLARIDSPLVVLTASGRRTGLADAVKAIVTRLANYGE